MECGEWNDKIIYEAMRQFENEAMVNLLTASLLLPLHWSEF